MLLEGKSYSVAEASVSVHLTGNDLVAVGEEVPFGREGARLEYQVELEGLDTRDWSVLRYLPRSWAAVYTLDVGGKAWIWLAEKAFSGQRLARKGGVTVERQEQTSRDRAEEVSREIERDSRRYPASL